eukprot:3822803-Pyramimonas_sp.AAC.1
MHRYWECERDVGSPAYEASAQYSPAALAKASCDEGFWLRGLPPAPWAWAPAPVDHDAWWPEGSPE